MTLKLLIFWDYDTQWGADRSRLGGPKDWGPLEFENTERLLELHDQYQVPACFAVVGAAAKPGNRPYSDPNQIRQIHAMGHEVGSHTFFHDWLPGLDAVQLRQTLKDSKTALEDCIGAPVTSFVPPYNQPHDFFQKGSISLSERREARGERTDIPELCRALVETGYTFSRVSYKTPMERILLQVKHRRKQEIYPETIEGLTCLRLAHPAGFTGRICSSIERKGDGYVVAYGHPHSLRNGGPQDEKYLVPFFERVKKLESDGRIQVLLPRQIVQQRVVAGAGDVG
jgi:hypothetical protein